MDIDLQMVDGAKQQKQNKHGNLAVCSRMKQ